MMIRRNQRSDAAARYRHLYNTARWRATRAQQLSEHPLCQRCDKAGFVVAATVCNHDDPKTKLNPATFFDGPWSSVCKACHDQAIQSDERTGRATTRVGYRSAVDVSGWPSDGRHPANLRG